MKMGESPREVDKKPPDNNNQITQNIKDLLAMTLSPRSQKRAPLTRLSQMLKFGPASHLRATAAMAL